MPKTKSDDVIRIKATITADHKLVADVPEDMPEGEVEVTMLRPNQTRPSTMGNLKRILRAAESSSEVGRSAEEIDKGIRDFREEWER